MMNKQEQIKIILADCNFKEIHSVMTFLNWKWSYSTGEKKVPTVSDLRSVAEDCLRTVMESKEESDTHSAGGFEAEKINNTLELRFILERVNPLSQILNTKHELARKS